MDHSGPIPGPIPGPITGPASSMALPHQWPVLTMPVLTLTVLTLTVLTRLDPAMTRLDPAWDPNTRILGLFHGGVLVIRVYQGIWGPSWPPWVHPPSMPEEGQTASVRYQGGYDMAIGLNTEPFTRHTSDLQS